MSENQKVADRGWDGVTPRPPTLEDVSYENFMEGVRNFAIRELFPAVGAQVSGAVSAANVAGEGATADYADLADVVDPLPVVRTWKRIMRSQQGACLPVVKEGRLVGMVTETDMMEIARQLLEEKFASESSASLPKMSNGRKK